jgi:sulfite reductase (NADPH) flavoprotein alpha-component
VAAGLVLGAYVLFCLAIALREVLRRRAARRAAQALSAGTGAPILVVHASQTGFAEELAMATAKLLGDAGARVTLKSLAEVSADDLAEAPAAPCSWSAPPARATPPTPPAASSAT